MGLTDTDRQCDLADQLTARLTTRDACGYVELSGEIDSEIDAAPIRQLEADQLILDLDGVDRITSYGIQGWIKLLNDLEAEYYCFVGCRPPLVAQFNMVYEFPVDGELISLYLPYRCPTCAHEFEQVVDLRDRYSMLSNHQVPSPTCGECGEQAEFQDVPELYLEYVTSQGPPNPPEAVTDWLDDAPDDSSIAQSDREPFRVQKEVVGELTALWGSGYLEPSGRLERIAQGIEGAVVLVCSNIDGLDGEALRVFDRELDGKLLLARVSVDLLRPCADDPSIREIVRPVTVEAPVDCLSCDWHSTEEVELAAVVNPDSVDVSRGCPECYADLEADIAREERAFYRQFDPPPLPANVASYLNHCEIAPRERQRQGERVQNVVGSSFGPYTLEQRIGSGGMAEIFLASQKGAKDFERKVVIKRLRIERSSAPDLVESFIREAKFAAQLIHPNVVQVTDFGKTNQFYYIAMEYLDGPDLDQILQQLKSHQARMPAKFALFIAVRMCDALHSAHTLTDEEGNAAPVVHRDVSPQNILISSHGIPKLTDFGIARVVSDLESRASGIIPGKIAYLSPESIHPDVGKLDRRSDIFSLGAVLFECLTNTKPFERESRQESADAILSDGLPDIEELRPGLPPKLDDILQRAMAKDPEERFATARQFQEPLNDLLRQLGVVTERDLGDWMVEVMSGNIGDEESTDRTAAADGGEAVDSEPTAVDSLAAEGDSPEGSNAVPVYTDKLDETLSLSILLIEADDPSMARSLAQIATAAVDQVDIVRSLDAIDEPIDSYEIVLFNSESFSTSETERIFEAFQQQREEHRFLVSSRSLEEGEFSTLLREFGLTNLVAHTHALDRSELLTTFQKILTRDIFGLEKYFSWGSNTQETTIRSSEEILDLVEMAEGFVGGPNTSSRYVRDFSRVTEELALNAVYNAPVDASGERKYAHLSRKEPVRLAEGERVDVTFCHDGQRAGISVRDPFGSLTVDQLLKYLARSFDKTDGQVQLGEGGAGLGLYQSFKGLSHMIVNVEPGQTTEFIGILHLEESYSEFASAAKSLNVFLK